VNAFTKCNNFPLVCLFVAYVRISFCLSVCKSYCTDQVVTSKCNCMLHMSPWFCLYYTPSSICLKFLCLCCSICKVEVLVVDTDGVFSLTVTKSSGLSPWPEEQISCLDDFDHCLANQCKRVKYWHLCCTSFIMQLMRWGQNGGSILFVGRPWIPLRTAPGSDVN